LDPKPDSSWEEGIPADKPKCPVCAHEGSGIPRKVLFQHLDAKGILDIFNWRGAYVCMSASCPCLYYSGSHWISHERCNKRVGFKCAEAPRLLCYCFGYTAEEILKKAELGQEKPILDQIEGYLGKGARLCQSTNPTGRCCLSQIKECLNRNSG
jgi:hypothetical protein